MPSAHKMRHSTDSAPRSTPSTLQRPEGLRKRLGRRRRQRPSSREKASVTSKPTSVGEGRIDLARYPLSPVRLQRRSQPSPRQNEESCSSVCCSTSRCPDLSTRPHSAESGRARMATPLSRVTKTPAGGRSSIITCEHGVATAHSA
eukprot:1577787-Prymnesium_polylepis.1